MNISFRGKAEKKLCEYTDSKVLKSSEVKNTIIEKRAVRRNSVINESCNCFFLVIGSVVRKILYDRSVWKEKRCVVANTRIKKGNTDEENKRRLVKKNGDKAKLFAASEQSVRIATMTIYPISGNFNFLRRL